MMTFEKVLEVFAAHLREDTDCEVIRTRHGYTALLWDGRAQEWDTCEYCPTPEALRDRLAEAYDDFAELKITGGERELTGGERARIDAERDRLKGLCST